VFCHVALPGIPAWLTSRGDTITTRSVGDPPFSDTWYRSTSTSWNS
jgi:hypothetical protein